MLRVLVCGSRNWVNIETIRTVIERLQRNIGVSHVIEGGCRGADLSARIAAEGLGIKVEEFQPDWNKYGRHAGPIRNHQMIREGKPDCVIAFSKRIERVSGTYNMVRQAETHLIPVWRFEDGAQKLAEFIVKLRSEHARSKTFET